MLTPLWKMRLSFKQDSTLLEDRLDYFYDFAVLLNAVYVQLIFGNDRNGLSFARVPTEDNHGGRRSFAIWNADYLFDDSGGKPIYENVDLSL